MPAFVAENCTGQQATGSAVSANTSRQINSGEHVVVTVKSKSGAGAVTSVTVGSLSLTQDEGLVGPTMGSEIWSARATSNIASASTVTVNFTNSGTNNLAFVCMSLSGVATNNYVRASNASSGNGQSPTTGSMTPASTAFQHGDMMVSTYGLAQVLGATAPSGETKQTELSSGSDIMETGQGAVNGYPGAKSEVWTAGGATSNWTCSGVGYAGTQTILMVKGGGTSSSKTSAATQTVTVPTGGHAAGNTLIVAVFDQNTNVGLGSMADARGNTYTRLAPDTTGTANKTIIFGSVLTTALQAGDLVTFTGSAATQGGMISDEFANLTLTEDVASPTPTTASSATPSISITPVATSVLVFGGLGTQGPSGDVYTEDTDTTNGVWSGAGRNGTTGGSATANRTVTGAFKITTAAGAQTWNPAITSRAWNQSIVALRAAAVGANLTQSVTDTATVADSTSAERGFAALPADTATVADTQAFGYGEGLADTGAVADAQTTAAGFDRTTPDTATVADSATAARGVAASPADTATVADSTSQLSGKEAVIADSVGGSVLGQNVGGTYIGDDLIAWDAGQSFTVDLDYIVPPQSGAGAVLLGVTNSGVTIGGTAAGYVPAIYIDTAGNLRVSTFWHGSTAPPVVVVNADDGIQHHLTVTYDGSTQRTYYDGSFLTSWVVAQTSFSASYSFFAGASGGLTWVNFPNFGPNNWGLLHPGCGVSTPTFRSGVQSPLAAASLVDDVATASGKNTNVNDSATVADAQTPSTDFNKSAADTATVADAQTPSAGFNKTAVDTATVADAQSFSYGFNLTPGDTATVTDTATASAGFNKTVPDTATVADAQSFGYGEGITDTAAVADAQSTVSADSTTVADTATVADSSTASAGFNTAPTDTATVADSQSFQSGKEAVVPDTVTAADAATASAGFNKPVADTATVADSTSAQSGKETTVPDTLTVADAQSTVWGAVAAVADTATVADAQSFQFSGGTTIADVVGVADSLSTIEAFAISTADVAGVADALRFDLSASLADALSVADSLTPSKGWSAQVADTLIVADAATTASAVQAALSDNVSVADATAFARGVQAALADTASVADAQSFQRDVVAAVADALGVADATSFAQGRAIVIPDILVVADARALGIAKSIDDALAVSDLVSLLGSGASAAYIHHVPPLRGNVVPTDSSGLVAVVATNEIVAVYSASGLVVAIDANGEVVATGTDGDVDEFVTSGLVLSPLDEGVNV